MKFSRNSRNRGNLSKYRRHLSQISKHLSKILQRTLPSDTIPDLSDQCDEITFSNRSIMGQGENTMSEEAGTDKGEKEKQKELQENHSKEKDEENLIGKLSNVS